MREGMLMHPRENRFGARLAGRTANQSPWPSTGSIRLDGHCRKELVDLPRYIDMILLQREVTCIVVIDGCVGHFLPDCFSARRQEDGIVLAPHDQCARLMHAQVCLPYGKRSDVVWNIELQVDH